MFTSSKINNITYYDANCKCQNISVPESKQGADRLTVLAILSNSPTYGRHPSSRHALIKLLNCLILICTTANDYDFNAHTFVIYFIGV